jgi:hypothetical protein
MQQRIIHRASAERNNTFHPRAIRGRDGSILLFIASGNRHYLDRAYRPEALVSTLGIYLYRSFDRGNTWQEPSFVCRAPFGSHAAVPFRPRDGKGPLYLFGTEPTIDPALVGNESNTIGYRGSDDDGHSWSTITLIRPTNDPEFLGFSAMRLCETQEGTWLLSATRQVYHSRRMEHAGGEYVIQQYVLRSADRGATWQVHPMPSPHGGLPGLVGFRFPRCEEANIVATDGGRIVASLRTTEGHVWLTHSDDDGLTWNPARSTGLMHPSAPPSMFRLTDGRLLLFTHNCSTDYLPDGSHSRSNIYASLSIDSGATWSPPQLFARTDRPKERDGVCYPDVLQDGQTLHVFLDHHFADTIYVQLSVGELDQLTA